jgi:polyhydroxybutyrate depolymerase
VAHATARRRLVRILTVAAWLAGGTALVDPPLTIEHQGIPRQYLLHHPPANTSPRPLLIYLHGLRPASWQNHTQAEIGATADREGFVVVYPAAVEGRWNYTGQLSGKVKAGDQIADDVGFLAKLLDNLSAENIADPRRVYAIGEARGGLMAFELMCRLADRIAAAAPLITGMTEGQRDGCAPSWPVPVFAVNGTADPIQWYDGWLSPTGRLLSVPETMEFWRSQHGCTGQKATLLSHRVAADPTRIQLVEWTGCRAGDTVRLYRVEGGGHQVPSFTAASESWVREAGRQNQDIETIDEFWNYAKRLDVVRDR